MSDSTTKNLGEDTNQAFIEYSARCQQALWAQYSIRAKFAEMDRYYQAEQDQTIDQWRSRLANKQGDASKFQNLTAPITMPQVEAALGYFVNVFLTGYPIFGIASDPTQEDAATQLEALVAQSQMHTGWTAQFIKYFRNGLKYNLCALELEWAQDTVPAIVNDIQGRNGGAVKNQIWNGNRIRSLDMYNTFYDPRVKPSEVHSKGDFAGYTEVMSRSQLLKFIADRYNTIAPSVIEACLTSYGAGNSVVTNGAVPFSWYQPVINPFPTLDKTNQAYFSWDNWMQGNLVNRQNSQVAHSNVFNVTKQYQRIIPADFGITSKNKYQPEIWKTIIINGKVVLLAEKQEAAHSFLPIFLSQPIEDDLDYQTKSFAENVQPMQNIANAMYAAWMASKRRLVGDRAIYDPSRIRESDVNNINPAAKIPVRPSAYGKDIREAFFAIPYHDEPVDSLVQGADLVNRTANIINGQNPAQQGQFVKGNKTLHEYDDVMGHGNSRNQVMAMTLETNTFIPLKEAILLNFLQFQPAGDIFHPGTGQTVQVQPSDLRKAALAFKISDGLLPKDKELSTDEFISSIQAIASSPTLAQDYNVGDMFAYLSKIRGADLTPFKKPDEQLQYEQQMAAWQQAAQMAAQKGSTFSTPMPQPPPKQPPASPPGSQNTQAPIPVGLPPPANQGTGTIPPPGAAPTTAITGNAPGKPR